MPNHLTTPADCPVLQAAMEIAVASTNLARRMRHLRRLTLRCTNCESAPACPALQAFNAAIDDAIQTIAHEYGLT